MARLLQTIAWRHPVLKLRRPKRQVSEKRWIFLEIQKYCFLRTKNRSDGFSDAQQEVL